MPHKPTSLKDKALIFILDNFTDEEGLFQCPYITCNKAIECDECEVEMGFNDIFGL